MSQITASSSIQGVNEMATVIQEEALAGAPTTTTTTPTGTVLSAATPTVLTKILAERLHVSRTWDMSSCTTQHGLLAVVT